MPIALGTFTGSSLNILTPRRRAICSYQVGAYSQIRMGTPFFLNYETTTQTESMMTSQSLGAKLRVMQLSLESLENSLTLGQCLAINGT